MVDIFIEVFVIFRITRFKTQHTSLGTQLVKYPFENLTITSCNSERSEESQTIW